MICAIIQARMGSTRLPGKMMMPVGTYPLFELVIKRVKQSALIDKVILASTDRLEDRPLLSKAQEYGILSFAGNSQDVLDRYYQCAYKQKASTIVRITGDCPFIDPRIIDEVIAFYTAHTVSYASNFHPPTYPNGFEVEVFSFAALEKAWTEAQLPSEREHVTPYIWKNPHLFPSATLSYKRNVSRIRLSIDEHADLQAANAVAAHLNPLSATLEDILAVIETHPEICEYNQHITRNEGYKKSLADDVLTQISDSPIPPQKN